MNSTRPERDAPTLQENERQVSTARHGTSRGIEAARGLTAAQAWVRAEAWVWAEAWVRAAAWLLGGLALLWGLLAWGHARLRTPAVEAFDHGTMLRVHGGATPVLTAVALAFTHMGSILYFSTALLLVLGWMLWRGRRHGPALLACAMTGALLLNETLKVHFHRVRPNLPWSIGDEHTFSYPSGHSFFSAVMYGTLAYLALRRARTVPRRASILLPAVAMPLAIGCSRIYLGMHFPTDVAAGFCAGVVWVSTVVMVDRVWLRWKAHRDQTVFAGARGEFPTRDSWL